MFETRDLPFHDLPEGEGPPILLTAKHGDWTRLGFGQGRLVRFSEDPGGAFAFGLLQSVVLIWVYLPPDEPGRAYCYHAPLGPLTPQIHRAAVVQDPLDLTVASQLPRPGQHARIDVNTSYINAGSGDGPGEPAGTASNV